jgi:hypothetical protein
LINELNNQIEDRKDEETGEDYDEYDDARETTYYLWRWKSDQILFRYR